MEGTGRLLAQGGFTKIHHTKQGVIEVVDVAGWAPFIHLRCCRLVVGKPMMACAGRRITRRRPLYAFTKIISWTNYIGEGGKGLPPLALCTELH